MDLSRLTSGAGDCQVAFERTFECEVEALTHEGVPNRNLQDTRDSRQECGKIGQIPVVAGVDTQAERSAQLGRAAVLRKNLTRPRLPECLGVLGSVQLDALRTDVDRRAHLLCDRVER